MEREPQVLIFEENRRRKQGRRKEGQLTLFWIHDGEEEGIVVLGVVGVKQEGRV